MNDRTSQELAYNLLNPSAHDQATGQHSWKLSQTLPKRRDVAEAMANLEYTGNEDWTMVRSAISLMATELPDLAAKLYTRWHQAGHEAAGLFMHTVLDVPALEEAVIYHLKTCENPAKLYEDTVLPLINMIMLMKVAGQKPRRPNQQEEWGDLFLRLGRTAMARAPEGVAEVNQRTMELTIANAFIFAPSWNWQSGYDLKEVARGIDLLVALGAQPGKPRKTLHEGDRGPGESHSYIMDHANSACEALWRASAYEGVLPNANQVINALVLGGADWEAAWEVSSTDAARNSRMEALRMACPALVRPRLAMVLGEREEGTAMRSL